MKSFFKYVILICGLSCISGFLWFKMAPRSVHDVSVNLLKRTMRIQTSSESFPEYKMKYISRGKGDTILLIHGVIANKIMWLPLINKMEDYHIIALDLPGFGESTEEIDGDYTILQQKERLSYFIQRLNLKQFHLAGSSMGGALAAAYASDNPEKVLSLALFDPAGTYNCDTSDYFRMWTEENNNLLFIENDDDLKTAIHYLFHEPPFIAKFVNKRFMFKTKDSTSLRIFEDLYTEQFLLDTLATKITTPTIIFWGEHDRIIDKSCGEMLNTKIKHSKLVVIENCGHVPMIEKAKETSALYTEFLKSITIQSSL